MRGQVAGLLPNYTMLTSLVVWSLRRGGLVESFCALCSSFIQCFYLHPFEGCRLAVLL